MAVASLFVLSARPAEPDGGYSTGLAVGTGMLALVLVVLLRSVLGHAWTAAHEGGHAMFVVVLGGHVAGVRLERDHGGVTSHSGVGGLDRFFVTLAGYLGPSMFGLLGAALLESGETRPVLVTALVLLGLLLVTIRNVFGALVVCGLGGLIWFTLQSTSTGVQDVVAFTLVWFMLLGGVVDVAVLSGIRQGLRESGERDTDSDVAKLARMTLLPGALWMLFLFTATFAALLLGAALLTGLR